MTEKRKVVIRDKEGRYESAPVDFANLRKGDHFKFADEPLIGSYECETDAMPDSTGIYGVQAVLTQVTSIELV